MVLMLDSSDDTQNGKLQVSAECATHDVPLARGDVAIYRSHQRHRVTSVTKRRSVVVLEWWRGEATQEPGRPAGEARLLMEPATRALRLGSLASSTLSAWRDPGPSGARAAEGDTSATSQERTRETRRTQRSEEEADAEAEARVEL